MFRLLNIFIVCCIVVGLSRPVAAAIVYSDTFEPSGSTVAPGVTASWTDNGIATTPSGRHFRGSDASLGYYNTPVGLTVSNLPAHSSLSIAFDLYVIQSWDGSGPSSAPDVFDLTISSTSTSLIHATFSNAGQDQSYPDNYVNSGSPLHTYRTGAAEINTLGYTFVGGDTVYHLVFTVNHLASSETFTFSASFIDGAPVITNESWGLDNVVVSTAAVNDGSVPEPASMAIWGIGALGCAVAGYRRRKAA